MIPHITFQLYSCCFCGDFTNFELFCKCIKTTDFEELDSWLALLTEKLTGPVDIADSMDVSLSKLLKMVKGRETWDAAVHGVMESGTTEQLNNNYLGGLLKELIKGIKNIMII